MAKRPSSGVPSPPKPPKLNLPKPLQRPSQPKPAKLKVVNRPPRPSHPKPARLAAPRPRSRPQPPKPPRLDFPKPHTSDSLTVIPQARVNTPIKTVLWISAYPALRETTKFMIEAEGFEFHSASDFLQVEAACQTDRFQLAVVDHTLSPKIKRAIAGVIHEKRPATLILELCQVSSEIPQADYLLIGHEPDALVRMVKRIARERNG